MNLSLDQAFSTALVAAVPTFFITLFLDKVGDDDDEEQAEMTEGVLEKMKKRRRT